MESSDYIAFLSAAVALCAAGFTFYSARQSKRQADAVLGDVPPVFSAFQIPDDGKEYRNRFAVEIVNHNRLPLYIQSIRLNFPNTVIVYRRSTGFRDLLSAIYDSVIENKKEYTFDIPLRVAGRFHSEQPTISLSEFNVSYTNQDEEHGFVVGVAITYKFDGQRHTSTAYASTSFDPVSPR